MGTYRARFYFGVTGDRLMMMMLLSILTHLLIESYSTKKWVTFHFIDFFITLMFSIFFQYINTDLDPFKNVLFHLFQLLVISSAWISYFLSGICTGSPTVIIPQLRRESNSTSAVSDEMASWMCK